VGRVLGRRPPADPLGALLSPAFSSIFDEALVQAHRRLVANPSDGGAKVEFVTTHGTWFLRAAVATDPALGDNVRGTLRSLRPVVAESLTPPDREGTDWDTLGASSQEIREFALSGLSRRLKIVGVPLDSL
jgi:hypothetical protein